MMPRLLALILAGCVLVGCGGSPAISSEAVGPSGPEPTAAIGLPPQTGRVSGGAAAADAEPMVDSPGASLVVHVDRGATVEARSAPNATAPIVASLSASGDHPLALLATMSFDEFETRGPDDTPAWMEVLLPVRPNGQTGWIPTDAVTPYRNGYSIQIDIGEFRMRVTKDGEVITDTAVALGKEDTPTPRGRFYLTELIRANDPGGVYGPYAFGLSGYSDTLRTFGSGNGVIGIHGTDQPGAMGMFVSHGCVRVPNDVIEALAGTLPLGTPVDIGG